ncbi:sulfotransferase family 2 domain-containing protein [Alteromonas macleodii]|uniref:sulfotransferase family 2 domain-containing protein n=1 Tax=Alteromonas macleodii TaxID=28108 RepID=UPI003CFE6E9A
MPVMIKDGMKVLFIHIPKCGGSSLEREFGIRGWSELFSIRGMNAKYLDFIKCTPQHMHYELLGKVFNFDNFNNIITVVRNPVSRFRSEYYWQLKKEITNLDPKSWIEDTFDKYQGDNFIYDNHIRPQCEFVFEGVTVFKLENDGINSAISFLDSTKPKENFFKKILSGSHSKKLKETVKKSEIDEVFFEHESIIKKFYEKDIELFNY